MFLLPIQVIYCLDGSWVLPNWNMSPTTVPRHSYFGYSQYSMIENKNKGKNDHVPVAFKHFIQILRVLLIPFLHPMASQRNNVSGMSEFKIKYNMNLIVFVRVFGWIQSSITFFMMRCSKIVNIGMSINVYTT